MVELVEQAGRPNTLARGVQMAIGDEAPAEAVDRADVHLAQVVVDAGEIGDNAEERLEALAQVRRPFR